MTACACNRFQATGKCPHTAPFEGAKWRPPPPTKMPRWIALSSPPGAPKVVTDA